MRAGRSLAQSKKGLVTTALGTKGALSFVSTARSSLPQPVAEHRRVPFDLAVDRLGVGVEQQLGRVAAVSGSGFVGSVDPEAVALPRADPGHVAVPAQSSHLGERDARLGAVIVEKSTTRPARPPQRRGRSSYPPRRRWRQAGRAARARPSWRHVSGAGGGAGAPTSTAMSRQAKSHKPGRHVSGAGGGAGAPTSTAMSRQAKSHKHRGTLPGAVHNLRTGSLARAPG